MTIPLLRPHFDDDEIKEVKKVLDSGWVSQGPKVKEFEQNAAEYLGTDHAIAVSNCTTALHLSLLTAGVRQGDEVLVADFTFPATGHSVLYCGAQPVFVDVDPGTYNIDPERIVEKTTDRTKAIIPVHTFGQTADMDPIMGIAREHGLKVIEDAACAFGSRYDGRMAGTIGDMGCYSFHARKGITTGEGGMVVTNDEKVAERIRYLSVFGMRSAWSREGGDLVIIPEFHDVGYNYKMSDITAAIGVAQLRKIDMIIERKRLLAERYDHALQEIEGISPPVVDKKSFHIYQSYVALVDAGIDRNELIVKLKNKGIQCQIGTYSSHIQPVYEQKSVECPVSLDIFNRTIALPMYFGLDFDQVDEVVNGIRDTIHSLREGMI